MKIIGNAEIFNFEISRNIWENMQIVSIKYTDIYIYMRMSSFNAVPCRIDKLKLFSSLRCCCCCRFCKFIVNCSYFIFCAKLKQIFAFNNNFSWYHNSFWCFSLITNQTPTRLPWPVLNSHAGVCGEEWNMIPLKRLRKRPDNRRFHADFIVYISPH